MNPNNTKVSKHIMSELKRIVLPFSGKDDFNALVVKIESFETLQDKIDYIKKCVEFIRNNEPTTLVDHVK